MIFVDSTIPMYLVGADHPLKAVTQETLERLAEARETLVTDSETLQEILHRYTAIRRPEAIDPALEILLDLTESVFEVGRNDVLEARELLRRQNDVSARDAIHWAVMMREQVELILTHDRDFDRCPGVARVA